ncbi:hypothetical protein CVT26_004058 [Gymnopilus dilepis]|uniref:Uncharacterized protein n=1 Tax=Gymnopilus dilepis TaxID=231916 RepID=A0A409YML6_9AGAR|nr:hypothetical protein CVT26_004058 [Gymnopilus dilepis]
MEESPGLFLFSASTNKASPSARIISAALSALSTASVYSQDSWQGDKSPFAPILVPPPQLQAQQYLSVRADTRRHAIALSPSVQWENLLEDAEDGLFEVALNTPLPQSAAHVEHDKAAPDSNPTKVAHSPTTSVASESLPDIPVIKLEDLSGGPAVGKLHKKKPSPSEDMGEKASKRVSKHARAFGKVMGHLSLQPSKRDPMAANKRRNTTPVVAGNRASQEYKLPELKQGMMASPIRMSFIAKSGAEPLVIPGIGQAVPVPTQVHYLKASQVRQTLPANPRPEALAPEAVRKTLAPIPRRPNTPPLPATLLPTTVTGKKGHRRYKSSPAVPEFDFNAKRRDWEREDVPPLPVMPPLATLDLSVSRTRAMSVTARVAPSVPFVRAVDSPFPGYNIHRPREGLVT